MREVRCNEKKGKDNGRRDRRVRRENERERSTMGMRKERVNWGEKARKTRAGDKTNYLHNSDRSTYKRKDIKSL